MRVLVTGVGGFIGNAIARHLLSCNIDVIGNCRTANERMVGSGIPTIACDINKLSRTRTGGFDAVVHCAAAAGACNSNFDILRSNVIAMQHMMKLNYQAKFIFMSSMSIYGEVITSVVNERTSTRYPTYYGKSKLYGEALLELHEDQFPSISLRLPGVIGPGSHDRNWLGRVVKSLKAREPIQVFNPNSYFNNAVHVADLCEFVERLLILDYQGHNPMVLGTVSDLTVTDVVMRLAAKLQVPTPIKLHQIPTTSKSFRIDSAKARGWGYEPMDLRVMLDRFAEESR